MNPNITIEVAYAKPDVQSVLTMSIPVGSTIEAAILASGILALFPEIDLQSQKVGIFGKEKSLKQILKEGDRVEIYRPLLIDPKERRRLKAVKKPRTLAVNKPKK